MKTRVIVLGQRLRGDDGIALEMLDRFPRSRYPRVEFVAIQDDILRIMEWLHDCDAAIVVDCFAAGPGDAPVIRYDLHNDSLPVSPAASSHGLGLETVVELARKLDTLPEHFVLIGIAGYRFGYNEPRGIGFDQRLNLGRSTLIAELDDLVVACARPESETGSTRVARGQEIGQGTIE